MDDFLHKHDVNVEDEYEWVKLAVKGGLKCGQTQMGHETLSHPLEALSPATNNDGQKYTFNEMHKHADCLSLVGYFQTTFDHDLWKSNYMDIDTLHNNNNIDTYVTAFYKMVTKHLSYNI